MTTPDPPVSADGLLDDLLVPLEDHEWLGAAVVDLAKRMDDGRGLRAWRTTVEYPDSVKNMLIEQCHALFGAGQDVAEALTEQSFASQGFNLITTETLRTRHWFVRLDLHPAVVVVLVTTPEVNPIPVRRAMALRAETATLRE